MIKKPQWHIERSTDHTADKVALVLGTGEDHEINHFLDALLLKSHEPETIQLIRLLKSREKWDDKQQAITSWMHIDDLPKLLDLLLELANVTDPFVDNKRDAEDTEQPSFHDLTSTSDTSIDSNIVSNDDNEQDSNVSSAPGFDVAYDDDKPLGAESLTPLSSDSDQVFDYKDLNAEGSENS